jgi:Pyruvate/2-oxoacid:ferredoxin oxidoreductase gamma subunit
LDIAQQLNNTRVLNVVLLGALSGLTHIPPETWTEVIVKRVPAKAVELNVQAFWRGRDALATSRLSAGTDEVIA